MTSKIQIITNFNFVSYLDFDHDSDATDIESTQLSQSFLPSKKRKFPTVASCVVVILCLIRSNSSLFFHFPEYSFVTVIYS